MKFKIELKIITTLKRVENFKRWKQEVEMLLNSQEYAYLLKPCLVSKKPTLTSLSTSENSLNEIIGKKVVCLNALHKQKKLKSTKICKT